MSRLRQVVLLALSILAARGATCPSGIPATDHGITAAPDHPKTGDAINFAVTPALDPKTAPVVCFDNDIVEVKDLKNGETTSGQFQAPGDPKQGAFHGIHTISVVADGKVYSTTIGGDPFGLTSVEGVPLGPSNATFKVRLVGQGFDTNDRIQWNDESLDVCWNDADCKARNIDVRANVLENGHIIELIGVDPYRERSARFRVFNNGIPTRYATDSQASLHYWEAVGASAGVTLLLIAVVVVLVRKYLRETVIEGDHYLVRALFLDKETNTYSLSKLQFYLWTIVAIFGYVYLATAKNWFQHLSSLPPVPSGLPGIVAIAGGTAVGSQVVTNINGPKGGGQIKPSPADFVTTGDVVAAERVQFFVWTIIGAIGFLLVVASLDPRVLQDLPEVPSSMLAISGLSAFGYLGGKLARNPGPVVTEVMAGMGPDPDAVPPTPASAPQTPGSVAIAQTQLSGAKQRLQGISASAASQTAVAAANRACDAAGAAIQAAQASGDTATISAQVRKGAADADAASREAATAATSLPSDTPKTDSDTAATAASAAQQALAAAQALATAIQSTPATAKFGILELRGRTLSRDGNFRVSRSEASGPDDLDISFDSLQPSPKDDKRLKVPRVIERDDDSTDPTMAKRLLLVINVPDNLRASFVPSSTHTLTVINPDSQKALFKFQVPESQKP